MTKLVIQSVRALYAVLNFQVPDLQNKEITSIKVEFALSSQAVVRLGDIIRGLNLEILDLSNTRMDEGSINALSHVLKRQGIDFYIDTLSLSSNPLDNVGIIKILTALKGKKINTLDFTHCNINLNTASVAPGYSHIIRQNAETVERLLKNVMVSNLILDRNSIGDSGAFALSNALPYLGLTADSTPGLISLSLERSQIGDDGAIALANTIKTATPFLSSLNLKCNRITSAGAVVIAEAMRDSTVSYLDLAYNRIDDNGATAIAEALPLSALMDIRLFKNPITKQGIEALSASVPKSLLFTTDIAFDLPAEHLIRETHVTNDGTVLFNVFQVPNTLYSAAHNLLPVIGITHRDSSSDSPSLSMGNFDVLPLDVRLYILDFIAGPAEGSGNPYRNIDIIKLLRSSWTIPSKFVGQNIPENIEAKKFALLYDHVQRERTEEARNYKPQSYEGGKESCPIIEEIFSPTSPLRKGSFSAQTPTPRDAEGSPATEEPISISSRSSSSGSDSRDSHIEGEKSVAEARPMVPLLPLHPMGIKIFKDAALSPIRDSSPPYSDSTTQYTFVTVIEDGTQTTPRPFTQDIALSARTLVISSRSPLEEGVDFISCVMFETPDIPNSTPPLLNRLEFNEESAIPEELVLPEATIDAPPESSTDGAAASSQEVEQLSLLPATTNSEHYAFNGNHFVSNAGAVMMKLAENKETIKYLFSNIIPISDMKFLDNACLFTALHALGGCAFTLALPSNDIPLSIKLGVPLMASTAYGATRLIYQAQKEDLTEHQDESIASIRDFVNVCGKQMLLDAGVNLALHLPYNIALGVTSPFSIAFDAVQGAANGGAICYALHNNQASSGHLATKILPSVASAGTAYLAYKSNPLSLSSFASRIEFFKSVDQLFTVLSATTFSHYMTKLAASTLPLLDDIEEALIGMIEYLPPDQEAS